MNRHQHYQNVRYCIRIVGLILCLTGLANFYAFSQQSINLSDHFNIRAKNGKSGIYCEASVNKRDKSTVGKYINAHAERFDFLLLNFPDCPYLFDPKVTSQSKAKKEYAHCLFSNSKLKELFNNLLPDTCRTIHTAKKSFNLVEVLNTGSKFFFCERVDRADTSITMHICVGINGLDELSKTEHSLELEAFLFEALYKNLNNRKKHPFFTEFYNQLPEFGRAGKKKFKDFDTYLTDIRSMMYDYVKKHPLFTRLILDYYRENKANVNFEII